MDKGISVIIVGGGLAGLTAAIHLSKQGLRVLLIEKNEFPKHKVCGEYLSNEVLPYLNWLSVDLSELNPTRLRRFEFSTVNGKMIACDLPMGGLGLSRYALDAFLLSKARELGCRIVQDQVEDILFEIDSFRVFTKSNGVIVSGIVLGAFGKRSSLDLQLKRGSSQKKANWLAVKLHCKVEYPADLVGLHNFEGGYCGVSMVENKVVNLCYLASYKSFKKHKNIPLYQGDVLSKNPHLKSLLDQAVMQFEQPLTISQLSFEKKIVVENHVLMIGDSAALIHPLCGNGMAIAIHSAKIASELIVDYYSAKIKSRTELEQKYISKWKAAFSKRLAFGCVLAFFMRKQVLSSVFMKILINLPFLIPIMVKQTHGKVISVN